MSDTLSAWPRQAWIKPEEFDRPEKLSIDVIDRAVRTREVLKMPMYFTTNRAKSIFYHPSGDAIAPDARSHGRYSYHKYGLDHELCRRHNKYVRNHDRKALAIDWDCAMHNPEELLDVYMLMRRHNLWTRYGLYPFWTRPGYHTDLGTLPYDWFQDRKGRYIPLTYTLYKEHVLDEWLL